MSTGPRLERSPEWGVVDSNEKPIKEYDSDESFATIPDVPYEPKVTFTGREALDSLCTFVSDDGVLGKLMPSFWMGAITQAIHRRRSLPPSQNGGTRLRSSGVS